MHSSLRQNRNMCLMPHLTDGLVNNDLLESRFPILYHRPADFISAGPGKVQDLDQRSVGSLADLLKKVNLTWVVRARGVTTV